MTAFNPADDMKPAEVIAAVRNLCNDERVKAELQGAWERTLDRLHPYYLAKRPRLKNFEVHHMNEAARLELFRSFLSGRPLVECEKRACERVGLAG